MARQATTKMIKGRKALEEFIQKIMAEDRVKLKDIKVVYGPIGFYTLCWMKRV